MARSLGKVDAGGAPVRGQPLQLLAGEEETRVRRAAAGVPGPAGGPETERPPGAPFQFRGERGR
jgi:hypothetical protein